MRTDAIQISANDNVATAIRDLQQKETAVLHTNAGVIKLSVRELIKYGHKFALLEIAKNTHIIKYGEIIGVASQKIEKGEHVHVHNVESLRGRGDLANE